MSSATFDRETLLDLTVNLIPLGILLIFGTLFYVTDPFGGERLFVLLQFGIIGTMFVSLAVLTYVSGKAVSEDEQRREAAE